MTISAVGVTREGDVADRLEQAEAVYLSFADEVRREGRDRLLRMMAELVRAKVPTVHLLLDTLGGELHTAVALYNVLRGLPIKVVTHNVGQVRSAGILLFLAGDERHMCPTSSFVFHGAGSEFGISRWVSEREMREKLALIEDANKAAAQILRARTRFSPADITRLGGDLPVDVYDDEALASGLVHAVSELAITGSFHHLGLTLPTA